jgi:glycosyltransferase involved in cell wall biosynthesis
VACIAFVLAAWQAERRYRLLPALASDADGAPEPSQSWPTVQVLIPARNESGNITRVVSTLLTNNYPALQVLVIDDHSSDETAALARLNGAQVLSLREEPPPGWTGKCNACEHGVRATESVWLLFTDADTAHTPQSVAAAVAFAEAHQLDALSLLLRQECIGFWEKVILPTAYQQFFAVLEPNQPAFNGQYILIRRSAYLRSGGFGAVRGRVMEDVALAELLARQGFQIALVNGHQVASVRMYDDLPALLRGMTKTAFAAARDRGLRGLLLGGLTFLGIFTLFALIYGLLAGSLVAVLGAMIIVTVNALALRPWMVRFGIARRYAWANLLAITILWGIGMVSTLRVISGRGVRWKGRTVIETRGPVPPATP